MKVSSIIKCKISHIRKIGEEIYQVGLTPADGTLVYHEPGQYLKLLLPDKTTRCFSIASESGVSELILQIKSASTLSIVLSTLRQQTYIDIEIPLGFNRLPKNDKPLLLIAGGTGIAQMRSIIRTSFKRNENRPIWLYWGVDQREQLYLHSELLRLVKKHSNFNYIPVVNSVSPNYNGVTGFPHIAAIKAHQNLENLEIIFSGSEAMAKSIYQSFTALGVNQLNLHSDWIDINRETREAPMSA